MGSSWKLLYLVKAKKAPGNYALALLAGQTRI
jgi:hypothetical protein